jgi:hypothetical protein
LVPGAGRLSLFNQLFCVVRIIDRGEPSVFNDLCAVPVHVCAPPHACAAICWKSIIAFATLFDLGRSTKDCEQLCLTVVGDHQQRALHWRKVSQSLVGECSDGVVIRIGGIWQSLQSAPLPSFYNNGNGSIPQLNTKAIKCG